MKNIYFILICILFLAPSCKKKEIAQLNQKNQELTSLARQRDSIINQLVASVNKLEKTMGIETREGDVKQRIEQDIEHLRGLLQDNEDRYQSVQRSLANSRSQRTGLNNRLDSLRQQLEDKNNQIAALNRNVFTLKTQIDTQQNRINNLVSLSANQNGQIETATARLNTGHYVMGDSRELLDKDVIVKKGGFLGLFGRVEKLNPQFKPGDFQRVNIQSDTLIEIPGKKVNLVTVHPPDAYTLKDSNNVNQLLITDPQRFWEASKFLVVENR